MTQEPQNPFQTPEAIDAPRPPVVSGDFDIGRALQDGWDGTLRNAGAWTAVFLVGTGLAVLSSLTIIGIFVVVPVLFWGGAVFALRANDGQGEVNDLFSGFSRYGNALGSMLGIWGLHFLISLPAQIIVQIGTAMDSGALMALGQLVNLGWTLGVVVRFYFAPFYAVDQGLGPMDAMRASWDGTRQVAGKLILYVIVLFLVLIAGFICLIVGVIPATWITYTSMASAYRQISGTSA